MRDGLATQVDGCSKQRNSIPIVTVTVKNERLSDLNKHLGHTGTLVIQPAADKPSIQSSAVPLFLLFYEPSVSLWHPLPFSPINRLKVKDTAGKRSS